MIDKKPKTYNEIIRLKKCYMLANYYIDITESMFNEIYDFLSETEENSILANQTILGFVNKEGKIIKTYNVTPKYSSFDKINMDDSGFRVTPSYDYSSSSYSGGSSGNNNNNNNNNNNS